jgi:hypothetical protein
MKQYLLLIFFVSRAIHCMDVQWLFPRPLEEKMYDAAMSGMDCDLVYLSKNLHKISFLALKKNLKAKPTDAKILVYDYITEGYKEMQECELLADILPRFPESTAQFLRGQLIDYLSTTIEHRINYRTYHMLEVVWMQKELDALQSNNFCSSAEVNQ